MSNAEPRLAPLDTASSSSAIAGSAGITAIARPADRDQGPPDFALVQSFVAHVQALDFRFRQSSQLIFDELRTKSPLKLKWRGSCDEKNNNSCCAGCSRCLCCWPARFKCKSQHAYSLSTIARKQLKIWRPIHSLQSLTAISPLIFPGRRAHFIEVLGMTVNGIPTGITGLNDQLSHIGDSLVLANNVHAGDKIVFFDQISPQNGGDIWYSEPCIERGRRTARLRHALRQQQPPACRRDTFRCVRGVRRSDKDLSKGHGAPNFDYLDETFVATNVAINATPLPPALPLFATGLGGLVLLGWRRKWKAASPVAECQG